MSGGGDKTPAPTAQEHALADVATKKLGVYEDNYAPLEGLQLKSTEATEGRKDAAKGLVAANIRQATDNGRGALTSGLAAGISENDSRSVFARSAMNRGTAKALAAGSVEAVHSTEDKELQGKLNYVGLGHGRAGQALQGNIDRARNATTLALSEAKSDFAESQGWRESIGGLAGAYTRYSQPAKKGGE